MSGYTAIANLSTGLSARTKINTQFSELFGETAKGFIVVADLAALAAIPAAYKVAGKRVMVLADHSIYEWNGTDDFDPATGPIAATTIVTSGKITAASLQAIGTIQGDGMSNLDGGITVTPASNIPSATFRRNSSAQTAKILQLQTEANAPLADIDKTGTFHGLGASVTGDLAAGGKVAAIGAIEGASAAISGLAAAGTGKFGDVVGGNYSEFGSSGVIKFNGNARVWKDMIASGMALRDGGTPPTAAVFTGGILANRFDAGASQSVHGAFELQHDYKEGTALDVHIHWTPTTTNAGNIVWGIEYSLANVDGTFGVAVIHLNAPAAAPGVVRKHTLTEVVSIPGTGLLIGTVIAFRIFRQNGGTDTFTGNAFLHSVGMHYEVDTVGSRQELIK